ncbi:MAG TPA: ABC transporter substrate-binding protein [Methylomirabilota bacterium]|nr:ABC transporter substrate-binding protein [Methylomirabilota bacterium]
MMRRLGALLLLAALLAPAAAPAAQTITFGIVSANPNYWAVFVGRDRGFYERHGITLDLVFTGTSAAATQALMGGSLHMTVSATDAAFIAQQKVPEMRQIFSLVGKLPYSLMVTPGIKRVEDLRGKVAGATTPKTGDAYILRSILDAHGLRDGRDYTVIVAGTPPARAEAMQRGTIQATVLFEPQVSFLKDRGMVELLRADTVPRLKDYPFISVLAMRPWIRANEDAVVRFGRATAEATAWLYDPRNRAEAVQLLARTLKVEDRYAENTYRVWVQEGATHPRDARLSPAGLRRVLENMLALGDLKPPLPDVAAYADFSLAR